MRYSLNDVWEELAFLGYHMHWSLEELLALEHRDRSDLVRRVGRLNDRSWQELASRV